MYAKIPPPVAADSNTEPESRSVCTGVYSKGDIVRVGDGVPGIVFSVDSDGRHGKAVSLEEWAAPWYAGTDNISLPMTLSGGAADAELIRTLPDWEKHFPAFSLCYRLGKGSDSWWLPSLEELTELYVAFNGGPPGTINLEARAAFNRCFGAAGGKALSDGVYWCSTSPDGRRAYCLDFTSGVIRHYFNYHYDWRCYHRVRAIAAF